MKQKLLIFTCILSVSLLCACQQVDSLSDKINTIKNEVGALPTVTPTPADTPKPTYVPKVTPKPTASPTPTPTPTVTPSPTPTAEATPTPTPEVTPSPTPTPTATPSPTPKPTPSPTPAPTATPKPTPTPEPTPIVYSEKDYAPMPSSVPFTVYIKVTPSPTPVPTPHVPSRTYATGLEVVEFAKQYVGYNYAYGEESPEKGFDCSGLVYYVYQQFGYSMNRTSNAMALDGEHVDPSDIEPGDVLCFYTSGKYMGHVGIYIGGGEYIHSKDSASGVMISPLSERKYGYEARRILK